MKSIIYVGMDVHKDSFNLCAIYSKTGEVIGETRIASDLSLVMKFINSMSYFAGSGLNPNIIF